MQILELFLSVHFKTNEFMQNRILILTFVLFYFTALGQSEQYNITVDFTNVKDDKVKVEIEVPKMENKKHEYVIPAVIPGSYSQKDFGRFVSDFEALDGEGNAIDFKRKGPNIFQIKDKEQKLKKVRYWVRDTWDADPEDHYVFQPGGTNIEKDENFVVNHQGFYGYFEGYKKTPYKITYLHPDGMYAATSLKSKQSKNQAEVKAKDYVYLVDNPVMISKPDTASFMAGDMKVNVSIYSPNGVVSVDSVVSYLIPTGNALAEFFGELPVKHYDFIMYFVDERSPNTGDGSYGALEHSYGSFYFIPEMPNGNRLRSIVTDIASHEFLHILTPLNIHAEEIEYFDFRDPDMSQHLWLYEGVTEYFAHLVQLQAGLIDEFQFMEVMSQKIEYASEFKDVSFTKMSDKILKKKYNDMYQNVYQKGALIAFLLDIRIRELTDHKKDLRSVLLELSERYGPSKPFQDDEIIDEIVSLVDPALEDFFKDYVEGKKELPFVQYFDQLGWNYEAHGTRDVPTFKIGKGSLGATEEGNLFVAMDKENPLGLKLNDVLLKVNGNDLDVQNLLPLYDLVLVDNKNQKATVLVERNGKEVKLESLPEMEEITIDYFIYGQTPDQWSAEQKEMRKNLLKVEQQ